MIYYYSIYIVYISENLNFKKYNAQQYYIKLQYENQNTVTKNKSINFFAGEWGRLSYKEKLG